MAASSVGSKCHRAEATTVSGIVRLGVDHIADGQHFALLGRIRHAEALGIKEIGAGIDLREGGLLRFRRIEP